MSMMAFADFGLKAIMGISGGIVAKANAKAQTTINEANAYAGNLVRAANNELGSKLGSLQRYNQSVNNQRVLENTGSAVEAAAMNYRRSRDSATQDDFEAQIQFAEQAGAQAAAGALSGLQGGVVDVINGTTALRKARIQQRTANTLKSVDYDTSRRLGQIALAGWDSLDSSGIADNLDYNIDVAEKITRNGNLLTDIFGGQSAQTLSSVTNSIGKSLGPSGKQTFSFAPASYNYGVE